MAASFSPSFTTMTGVPSVSASPEQRLAERGEDTVLQGAVIRGSRSSRSVSMGGAPVVWAGRSNHNAMNRR